MKTAPVAARSYFVPLILGLLLVWSGCDLGEEGSIDAQPFFEIEITGDQDEEIIGQQSLFAIFEEPETGEDGLYLQFVTFEEFQRGVSLTGRFDEVPDEGLYNIILVDEEMEEDEESQFDELNVGELVGLYSTYQDEQMQAYVSTTGALEIEAASEDVLEGSFEFSARLSGEGDADETSADVQVEGNFVAVRGEVDL